MDDIFSIIFFIWIAFALLEGIVRKKKMPPPVQLPSEDTNFSLDQDIIDIAQPIKMNQPTPKPKNELNLSLNERVNIDKSTNVNLNTNINLTQLDTMNAIILSEILSKPKALRRR